MVQWEANLTTVQELSDSIMKEMRKCYYSGMWCKQKPRYSAVCRNNCAVDDEPFRD